MNIKEKLTSRKFWLSVATFLTGLGTMLQGFNSGNNTLVIAGIICSAVSTCIYTISEAVIDAADRNVIDVIDTSKGDDKDE